MADSSESTTPGPTVIRVRGPFRLLYFLSVASSCALFACAGCCYLTSWFLRAETSNDPKAAVQAAGRIIEWSLPPGFEGQSATKIDNSLVKLDLARFEQVQGRGFIVVGRIHGFLIQSPEQLQSIIQQQTPDLKKIDAREKSTRAMAIHGDAAQFQIGHGEDLSSTTRYWQVTGRFRSEKDDAVLILQCEDEFLTEAQINAFLDSLK